MIYEGNKYFIPKPPKDENIYDASSGRDDPVFRNQPGEGTVKGVI